MRVAIFSDHTGGVYVYSQRLTKQLVELGAQVEFITHPPTGNLGSERLASLKHDGATIRPVPRHPKEVSKKQMLQLYQAYLDANADIIIPNYRTISFAACAKLPRKKVCRIIGICHDHTPTMYKYLTYYEPIMDGFICPATVSYEHLKKVLPHRRRDIRLIPHGIPGAGDSPPKFDGGEIRLIYHGRLEEEQKSVSSLIALAETLAKGDVDFRLILVGDGPDQQTYRDRVAERGSRAERAGRLPGTPRRGRPRERSPRGPRRRADLAARGLLPEPRRGDGRRAPGDRVRLWRRDQRLPRARGDGLRAAVGRPGRNAGTGGVARTQSRRMAAPLAECSEPHVGGLQRKGIRGKIASVHGRASREGRAPRLAAPWAVSLLQRFAAFVAPKAHLLAGPSLQDRGTQLTRRANPQ